MSALRINVAQLEWCVISVYGPDGVPRVRLSKLIEPLFERFSYIVSVEGGGIWAHELVDDRTAIGRSVIALAETLYRERGSELWDLL